MPASDNNAMTHSLQFEDKEIILIGTAHVSRESVELVESVIAAEKPDTVAVELCASRYESLRQKNKWQNMDIIKVIKEKKAFLLLANLMLASFQKRIAQKLDMKPGEEMIKAIEAGEANGAEIHLADRDIRVTLSRTWRLMGLKDKAKILFQLLLSMGKVDEISEADIEKMKQTDVLESLLQELGQTAPVLKDILITERDHYLAYKIRTAPGKKIVAAVGAGHVPGIKRVWNQDINIPNLEALPPKSKLMTFLKWGLPIGIVTLFVAGFFWGGIDTGRDMLGWWILANGVLAGVGALVAWAHPFTILSSILAAPLTSLNPMIAAGWVSGLVEAFSRKPKVMDLERLPEDILSIKGFWRNKVTRILLVVAFTNMGSSLGTLVAIPLMLNVWS